jgi:molybdopterin synthase catalytic subunit
MRLSVQEVAFDLGAETARFAAGAVGAGAIVTFTGLVRDNGGALSGLQIEHYPAMTERAILAMIEEACVRFGLVDALVIHRFGDLGPAEAIMMVATAAPHRTAAFEGAEFLMDYLKSRAPFWKKELSGEGAHWVAAKDEDEAALKRWDAAD